METLIEKLYNNNVIFSYYGFIDRTVLEQVLEITRSKLENSKETGLVISRVRNAINDCVDNIIRHNFYPDDERLHYKSLLVISRHGDDYLIDTLNVVNSAQKQVIDDQLEFLNSKNRDELSEFVSKNTDNGKTSVNYSLIDMVLKADNCDCSFKKVGSNYLFNINFRISAVAFPVNTSN